MTSLVKGQSSLKRGQTSLRRGQTSVSSLAKGGGASVNDARYDDYIAFADPRAGLYAVPDGLGGKREATAAEFWATPANVSFDSSLYGVRDMVLSAQTNVGAAVQTLMAATECTVVFESYGRVTADRMIRPNAGGDLFLLLSGGNNARMVASSVTLDCSRRRGPWTNRFRGVVAWSAAGRAISFNGGDTAEDATQPGARSSPNFLTGRYSFIGIIADRKSAAWMKANSFPEPTIVAHGDSMIAWGGLMGNAPTIYQALLPGSPPFENMATGGIDGPAIEASYLAEAPELTAKRIIGGNHNSYDGEGWPARVANMVANTIGGIANVCIFPTFPAANDDAGKLASKADLHAYMKSTYGPHYLAEALDTLVALGGPGQAYEDSASFAKGVPPAGLRLSGDPLHTNQLANETYIAPSMVASYPRMGWRV